LQVIFNFNEPQWFHHNLLRDKDGFKLSKSSKSTSIESYRENGFTPEKIIELIEHKENFPI